MNLLRRREMVQASGGGTIYTPVYELAEATSTAGYDTEVQLFDEPKTFTILCEAYWSNRNWGSSAFRYLLGLGTGSYLFNFGNVRADTEEYINGEYSSTAYRYTALTMNSSTSGRKGFSMFSRAASTTKTTHRFAIRYNHITRKVEGFSDAVSSSHPPTARWYELDADVVSSGTLKLNHSSGSTINILKIYDVLLPDADIESFVWPT